MRSVFNGTGPVFEAASSAFSALFEGSGVSRVMSKARHFLIDTYDMGPNEAADVVHAVKNFVFDPLAADGAKPELDPTFKKYIHLFPDVLKYLITTALASSYEIGSTEKTRLSLFGEAFRNYLHELPGNDVPDMIDQWKLARIDHDGSILAMPAKSGNSGYTVLRPKSSEELVRMLNEINATDVPWCIREESYWKTYSKDGENTFYLLYNSSLGQEDSLSILGVFLMPSGYIAHSFNRKNKSVPRDETAKILESCGISVSQPGSLNTAIELVNDGVYDITDVADTMEKLDTNIYLATSDRDDVSNVLYMDTYSHPGDRAQYHPIFPRWIPKEKIHLSPDYRIAYDDTTIYSVYDCGDVLHHAPEGFTFGEYAGSDDYGLICLCRNNATVNIFGIHSGHTLLAMDSLIPFDGDSIEFWSETMDRTSVYEKPSVDFSDPHSYWTLYTDKEHAKHKIFGTISLGYRTAYVVNKPGVNLADCPKITVPKDFCIQAVSLDGRSYAIERKANCDDYRHASYLIHDGKAVNNKGLGHIEYDGNNVWLLYPEYDAGSHNKYTLYDANTGKTIDED